MATHFRSVQLDARDLLEKAQAQGLQFQDDAEKVHFLEICELVYRMGAEFGFQAAMDAMLLRSPAKRSQMPN